MNNNYMGILVVILGICGTFLFCFGSLIHNYLCEHNAKKVSKTDVDTFVIEHPTWHKWKNIMKKLIAAVVLSFGVGVGVNNVDWTNFQDSASRVMGIGFYKYVYICCNCDHVSTNYIPRGTLIRDFTLLCSRCDAVCNSTANYK